MQVIKITGIDKVISNLRKAYIDIGKSVARGLKKGGLFLQRESQKICPVDIGNLKASAFTCAEGEGFHTDVIVGYTAGYAVYVHEDLDKLHGAAFNAAYAGLIAEHSTAKFKRMRRKMGLVSPDPYRHTRGENQQAKFLEQPAREKCPEITDIVAAEAGKI